MGESRPVTTTALKAAKAARRPIVMVTAYDAPSARIADAAGVDAILVGDSLGMVVLGYDSTLPVTMDDMLHHSRAVVRGAARPLIVVDMPFMSFQINAEEALRNAGRLMAEGGAHAVKIEGGAALAPTVARMVAAGIPVMGHVGLTPQSVHQIGGYKVQAKETAAALALLDDCFALQQAGAFAVVLECIPTELATLISQELAIPTIGIGAGGGCDGQVQVFHDMLGMGDFTPRHAKRYAETGDAIRSALESYANDVRDGTFPTEAQCSAMDPAVAAEIASVRSRGLRAVNGSGKKG
ncbi:MAG: 3-methyl-2-oxobutanoate hydroxymethyltransferase [Actinobacteria bacterium HGW-Actinobacteria-10]|jgi:3-methyl-2-oxobutanoate hydroxymethyltransferase|nr:MAG: 3-methyl-2-oxobutanoate hydroxymethyltransferase [Actinobacteria bacterium HGW-Actinobacteria-10]